MSSDSLLSFGDAVADETASQPLLGCCDSDSDSASDRASTGNTHGSGKGVNATKLTVANGVGLGEVGVTRVNAGLFASGPGPGQSRLLNSSLESVPTADESSF